MKVTSIEELFGTLQQSVVAEWRKHLKADNHDIHVILDEFYTEMPEKVDKLIEDYIGHTKNKVEDYKNVLDADEYDALKYLEELHEVCDSGRSLLNGVPELESDLDDVVGFIDSCMYKLRELTKMKKEGAEIKSLSQFLYEALNDCGDGTCKSGCSKDKTNKKDTKKGMKPLKDSLREALLAEKSNPDERLDLDLLSDDELETLVADIMKINPDFDKKYIDKAVHALLGNKYKVTAANFISKTCKAAPDDEVHLIFSNDNNQWWDAENGIWSAF